MDRATASSQAKNPPKDPPKKPDLNKRSTRATSDTTAPTHEGKSREDLYAIGGTDWKLQGTEGARTFLIMKGFISSDCDPKPSLASLALVLLRIAAPSPASALTGEALRAIAFLLEERKSDVVFDLVEAIDVIGTDVQKVLAYVEAEVVLPDDMQAAAVVLTRTVEEQSVELSTLTERLGSDLAEVMERAEAVPTAAPPANNAPASGVPAAGTTRTYAGVAANGGVPPRHAAALANAHARECQVMVGKSPLVEAYGLARLSEKELVEKANLALARAKATLGDESAPEKTAFVGARRVRSGAVVFHLTSAAAAEWIRVPKRMDALLEGMGGTSIYKPRFYSVVVEFVPVTFDPTLDRALVTIEDANGLGRGELVHARYIKPLARRNPGQRSAHAIFGFATAAGANHAIRHRLFVDGRRVSARKLLSEPIRCLKCQMIGTNHNVAACPSIHDVCARCGEMHRTDMCIASDEERACSNCRAAKRSYRGHGAADRNCPVFADKLQFALERNPEANYRFFPTDEPETWENLDRPATDVNNQAATWQDGNAWLGGYAESGGRIERVRTRGTKPGLPPAVAASTRVRMGGSWGPDAGWTGERMRQTTLTEERSYTGLGGGAGDGAAGGARAAESGPTGRAGGGSQGGAPPASKSREGPVPSNGAAGEAAGEGRPIDSEPTGGATEGVRGDAPSVSKSREGLGLVAASGSRGAVAGGRWDDEVVSEEEARERQADEEREKRQMRTKVQVALRPKTGPLVFHDDGEAGPVQHRREISEPREESIPPESILGKSANPGAPVDGRK